MDNSIKPEIVKEEPREAVFIKCEFISEYSDNETESVPLQEAEISQHKQDYKLQAPNLHSADDPLTNSSNEDVKPKVEKVESSLTRKENSIIKLIDAGFDVEEEEYLDSPEYLSTNIDFVLKDEDARPGTSRELEEDSSLQTLEVQDEMITGSEGVEEAFSAVLQKLSAPMEIDNKMKRNFSPKPLKKNLSVSGKRIQCKSCSKSFDKMSKFIVHERSHTGEKPFACQICSKSFSRAGSLKMHERVHTGEKPFHCMICSKSFREKGSLIIHERVHTGEKPYQCQICSKSFRQKVVLRNHEMMHTGEKPFHCQICSRSFSKKCHLIEHERLHTGEKPFLCQICLKSFSKKCHLIDHERLHTGEKPFDCKICSKSFSREDNMKIHERIHTGEKPFHCKVCSKSFSRRNILRIHERSHTGEKTFVG